MKERKMIERNKWFIDITDNLIVKEISNPDFPKYKTFLYYLDDKLVMYYLNKGKFIEKRSLWIGEYLTNILLRELDYSDIYDFYFTKDIQFLMKKYLKLSVITNQIKLNIKNRREYPYQLTDDPLNSII